MFCTYSSYTLYSYSKLIFYLDMDSSSKSNCFENSNNQDTAAVTKDNNFVLNSPLGSLILPNESDMKGEYSKKT